MEKYYYVNSICIAYGNTDNKMNQCFVTNKHPFIQCHEYNKMDNYETILLSWQEITKDEYDLFNKLENED